MAIGGTSLVLLNYPGFDVVRLFVCLILFDGRHLDNLSRPFLYLVSRQVTLPFISYTVVWLPLRAQHRNGFASESVFFGEQGLYGNRLGLKRVIILVALRKGIERACFAAFFGIVFASRDRKSVV